jgi:hypothetical protein
VLRDQGSLRALEAAPPPDKGHAGVTYRSNASAPATVGKMLQSLEPGARRGVESPLPADAPVAPGREKTCPQVGGPRGMPGAVLANLLLAPARPLRLDIPGEGDVGTFIRPDPQI